MLRKHSVLCSLGAALVVACSQPAGPEDAGVDRAAPADTGAGDVSSMDAVSTDADAIAPADTGTSDGAPAGVGQRCSTTRPCPSGLQCIDGACAVDCGGNALCGAVCCAAGQVCAAGTCVAPGMECTPTPGCGGQLTTCRATEYCDSALMRCLPNAATSMCTVPAARSFRPVESWSWRGSSRYPDYKGVLVTPLVADVDRDGASDVLVVAYKDPPASYGGSITPHSILCALSGPGDCMGAPRELWCTEPQTDITRELNGWGNIAVADLDATDGRNELTILAGLRLGSLGSQGIVAFDARGNRLWVGRRADGTPVPAELYGGGIAIADLEGDGRAEIIVGNTVFESTGVLRWQDTTTTCWGAFGPHSFAADISNPADGRLEVICGGSAYAADGRRLWTGAGVPAGWGGIADFDGNNIPEIVVVNNGSIAIFRNDGTPASAVTSFASVGLDGRGGPPTIADLDGDTIPDIGIAGSSRYGALRVLPRGAMFAIERAWTQPADDMSSNVTGSAMFDFDGDGQFEVIYQDTCRARVFAGRDGSVLLDIPNISGTATNYPTVADVNGDGRAEFITVSDSYYARSGLIPCPATTPRTDGVRVFRDANDNWQSTRGIWNQHAYSVTNVCDGVDTVCAGADNVHGAIPRRQGPSWTPALNSFRVNAQLGLVARRAADLVVLSVSANVASCPSEYIVRADIANRGTLSVPGTTPVAFYREDGMGMRVLLGTVTLGRTLPPGGTARVQLRVMPSSPGTFRVIVVPNDDGMGGTHVRECNSTNNASVPLAVDCTLIG
ncbi:MAG: VCBS repeat-containing protein [Myxococcales bacterium]|nr:VCBS repeat-containing protein [Myxococcales bacterium]